MATTAVLHANDTHKTEQSPHSIYSPNQSSVYNITGVSPTEGATPLNCAGTNFQQANYPLPPTRDAFQDLTPEPPAEDCSSQVQVCSANFIGSTSLNSSDNSEITLVCDPFYEPPSRGRIPSTAPPPYVVNMGDPKHSGIRLDLPRNVRAEYPEAAFDAVAMLNKSCGLLQPPPAPMYAPPRGRPVQYMSAPPRGVYSGAMNACGVSPSYPAPTPSPSNMSPSYMQQVRPMGCPKSCNSQMPPYGYTNVPYGPPAAVIPPMKKNQTTTGGRRKQNAKAAVEERAAKAMRKMDFNPVPCGNIYEQMADMGRPSTSAANNFGPMPNVMGVNPAVMGGQPSSTPSPPNPQMMLHSIRPQYPYDNPLMNNSHPNMQAYQPMQPMNNQDCGGLMQPPSLPMRMNGQLNNGKPGVDMSQMQKPSMFQQPAGMSQEMQPDGVRMFMGRSMEKNPHCQMHPVSSAQNDVYGGMNGSIPNNSGFPQPNHNLQRCGLCKEEIRDTSSIQCTGNGQGCLQFFHQTCSQMMQESFRTILNEPRAEWICNDCDRQRQILYS